MRSKDIDRLRLVLFNMPSFFFFCYCSFVSRLGHTLNTAMKHQNIKRKILKGLNYPQKGQITNPFMNDFFYLILTSTQKIAGFLYVYSKRIKNNELG